MKIKRLRREVKDFLCNKINWLKLLDICEVSTKEQKNQIISRKSSLMSQIANEKKLSKYCENVPVKTSFSSNQKTEKKSAQEENF